MWGATCLRSGCVFPWNPGVSWGGCREQSAELSECLSEWEPKSQATTTASCGKLPWGKPVFLTMIPHCHFCAPPAWYTKPPVAWSGAHWGSPLQVQFFVLYQALFESYPCPESSGTEDTMVEGQKHSDAQRLGAGICGTAHGMKKVSDSWEGGKGRTWLQGLFKASALHISWE